MSRSRTHARTVVVARGPSAPVETTEIRGLAEAAGHEVVAELTQAGTPDSGTYLGAGTVEELAALVAETGAGTVVAADGLTPAQHHALESAMPPGTAVYDRYRLVLEIFEARAGTRRARLQVELARLRYDLPRMIEAADEGMLNRVTESGTPVYDARDRIARLERKLSELPDPTEQFRARRREEGFDLLTIAGYTNAGKSTLLHRLADDMSLEDGDPEETDSASNKGATAEIEDRLFKTLETTTRRATIDGRPVLATDTVGFVDDLPHELVVSFSSTLSEAAAADIVVLVCDGSDDRPRFRDRLAVSLETLAEQGVEAERVVVAVNKVDRLSADELEARLATARESGRDAVPVSVTEGTNLEALLAAVSDRLPTERATLEVPNCDEAMALVSRAYDRTDVESVDYADGRVRIRCRGRPEVVDRLEGRAAALEREVE
ncbi:GTPase HflX [Natrononativus amylolyticus]|uniref:GTPase HflX n=1 Tax=Natrononativus amylolyticus TaxID=2963434 RepID=UPI0020CDAA10|nr:GTPase HflX [Natrononativus amylolyticus]